MSNFSVCCHTNVFKCTLTLLTEQVWNYLDVEAVVDNDEEEEISDDEIGESPEKRSHLIY